MSERSQLYVRLNGEKNVSLVARDNGWCYAERMISRCRWTMEWLRDNKYIDITKLNRILDVNFDMKDIVISSDLIEEHRKEGYSRDFEEYVFWNPGNNHGKLFIDVSPEGRIKYAFTDGEMEKIMTAKEYMDWDEPNWHVAEELSDEVLKTLYENLTFIENAELMTMEELQEFIEYDYVSEMNKRKTQTERKVLIEGTNANEWVLLLTDAPREKIGLWCDITVQGNLSFNTFVDDLVSKKWKIRILSSSVYNDDRSDIWGVGVDECYNFDDYVQEREEEKDER